MPISNFYRNASRTTMSWRQHMAAADGPLLLGRQALAFIGIALGTAALAVQCYRYLFLGAYFDHIEGNVVVSGWQYVHGAPLYQIEDGSPRFAAYYGPLAYLVEVPALLLFGADVTISKLTSMLALLGTVVLMGRYFLRHPVGGESRHGILLLLGMLLLFSPVAFWVRPDPIETLIVALAIISETSPHRPYWVGICLGLAVNLKIHAGFYFLPILTDLWWTGGCRALLIAVGSSAITFILPFLAPGISLHDYLMGLVQQVGGRAPATSQILSILITGVLLLLPLAIPLAEQSQRPRTLAYVAASIVTAFLLLYPATFPGAGAYHFLPLVPVLADVRHRLRPKGADAVVTPFLILLIAVFCSDQTSQMAAAKRGAATVAAEALALARESGSPPVQIGYGDNRQSYELSQLSKTVLALNSYPTLIDAQVLMELHQVGIDGSARWIPLLIDCHVGQWLLPRGETPFAITSYFYDNEMLFSEQFRRMFFESYKVVESTQNFDVWECRHHHPRSTDQVSSGF